MKRSGFILAEALVSLGLAALTGALALTLLVWAARTIDRAGARMEAATVIERLYEEARLASPADLRAVTSGTAGGCRAGRSTAPARTAPSGCGWRRPGRPAAGRTAAPSRRWSWGLRNEAGQWIRP